MSGALAFHPAEMVFQASTPTMGRCAHARGVHRIFKQSTGCPVGAIVILRGLAKIASAI